MATVILKGWIQKKLYIDIKKLLRSPPKLLINTSIVSLRATLEILNGIYLIMEI